MSRTCPPEKILNPASGRCVKRDGAIGRRILGVEKTQKQCAPTHVWRAETRRCVKRSGRLGQQILSGMHGSNVSAPKGGLRPLMLQEVMAQMPTKRLTGYDERIYRKIDKNPRMFFGRHAKVLTTPLLKSLLQASPKIKLYVAVLQGQNYNNNAPILDRKFREINVHLRPDGKWASITPTKVRAMGSLAGDELVDFGYSHEPMLITWVTTSPIAAAARPRSTMSP